MSRAGTISQITGQQFLETTAEIVPLPAIPSLITIEACPRRTVKVG
jgi:hypothetical protein